MRPPAFPTVDHGHTGLTAAFERHDVYGVRPDAAHAEKRPMAVGIAGYGGVAQAKWLPALRRLQTIGEPVTLTGVAEPDEATRAKVATLWQAPAFSDAERLLAEIRHDLLLILAADAAHVPIAEAAIAAGVPCLVEKPLCPTFAEAQTICDAADRQGVLLAGVANKRAVPPYDLTRRLVDGGALDGPPHVFTGKFVLGYPYVDLLSGGTIHLLDLMRWFMGPVERVHARRATGADEAESVVASFAFASGAIGTITTSAGALSFKPGERVEIIGHHATLTVEDAFELTLDDDETGPTKIWRPAPPNTPMFDECFGDYTGQLEHVLDAVRGEVVLGPTGRVAAQAIALVEAIRLSLSREADIDLKREGFA